MSERGKALAVDQSSSQGPPAPNDEGLVLHAVAGSEAAFRILYRRHSPRLRGVIQRLLGPAGEETDDVLQVVWLRAMLGAARFRWESAFSSWLCGIAVRASMEALRKAGRTTVHGVANDLIAPTVDVASQLDIRAALARLPDAYRVVLVLHDVEGFTHDEIAEQLAIPVGTSKSNLHRGRRIMRTLLTSFNEGIAP